MKPQAERKTRMMLEQSKHGVAGTLHELLFERRPPARPTGRLEMSTAEVITYTVRGVLAAASSRR